MATKNTTKSTTKKVQSKAAPIASETLLSYGVEPYSDAQISKEEYMCDGQRAHFEQILRLWLEDLLRGGDETIEDLQSSSNTAHPDISDQASVVADFDLKLRKRDRERKLQKKIETSLRQLLSDEYGFCEECGIEIGIRRLEARPTATLCIDCKTLSEIREKQQGK